MGSWKKEFKHQGYIFCKGFFSQDEMDILCENIKASDTKETTFGFDQNRFQYHVNILNRNDKIQSLISQPKVADLLSQIVGENIWVRWNQAISKDPGAEMMPWHQDNRYSHLKHTYYQLWIPLTKMTPENGALCLQPGSYCFDQQVFPHKFSEGFYAYEGNPEQPIFMEAEPGDIVVFSSYLLHCTAPNLTQKSRWAYIVECLPFEHFDPTVAPPYFVISRDGKSHPEFVHFYRHRLNPIHFFQYGWFKLKNIWYCWLRPVVNKVLFSIGKSRNSKTPGRQ
jgi:ectoine hydroxylase-related dioxygenase (phytanoyl-CoA dioxygenase family)